MRAVSAGVGREEEYPLQLLIVRHGQCLGQCDAGVTTPDSELSPLGERQARLTGRRLAGQPWMLSEREESEPRAAAAARSPAAARSIAVLSSPLVRALAMASIIAEALGEGPVEVWPELREGFSGRHRGFGRAELARRFPRAVLPPSSTPAGWEHGGDSSRSFFARAHDVVRMLGARFGSEDRVAMVTHGGFANSLLYAITGIAPARPRWFALDNCAISRVRFVPEGTRGNWPPLYPPVEAEIVCVNDVSHLAALA